MHVRLFMGLWRLGILLGLLLPGLPGTTQGQRCLPTSKRATPTSLKNATHACRYRATTTYSSGDMVVGRDANSYRAVQASIGKDPTRDNGSHWRLTYAVTNLTLSVPVRFVNLASAWTFLQEAVIPPGRVVTLRVADGTYRQASTLTLNHPSGSRIRLVGNAALPQRCKLLWPAGKDGLVVSGTHSLGLIQGFTLVGQANRHLSSHDPVGEAVAAYNGATLHAQNVVCLQWWHGFHASDSSDMVCTDCSTISIGDAGFFSYNGGTMTCTRCTGAASNGGYPLGFGFLAELASSMFLTDCTANGGSTAAGIGGFTNSSLEIRACTSRDNHQGMWLDGGSVAEVTSLTCSFNTLNNTPVSPTGGAHGILLQGGSKIKSGSSGITATFNGGRGLLVRDNSIFMAQRGTFSHNYSGLFAENNSSIDATNLVVQSNAYEGVLAVNNSLINLGSSTTVADNGVAGFGYGVNYAPVAGEWGNNHSYIQTTPHVFPARPLLTGSSPYPGSSPVQVLGAGAGTDAQSSSSGRDAGGQLTVMTGTSPVSRAPIINVIFARPYSSAPVVIICAADENSATAIPQVYVRSTPIGFTLYATGTALTTHKTYIWNYSVPGN